MSIDLFGDLVGKARRRELEGRVKLNLTAIGKRLAVGAVAAGIAAAARPDLLGTKPGVLSLVGIGLTAMIPAGAAPSGLITPAQPGAPSATEGLVQAAVNVAMAPADKRQEAAAQAEALTEAKIQEGVKAGLAKYGPTLVSLATKEITSQFGPGDLAAPSSAAPAPEVASDAQSSAETPTGSQTGITASDAAIRLVGGNQ